VAIFRAVTQTLSGLLPVTSQVRVRQFTDGLALLLGGPAKRSASPECGAWEKLRWFEGGERRYLGGVEQVHQEPCGSSKSHSPLEFITMHDESAGISGHRWASLGNNGHQFAAPPPTGDIRDGSGLNGHQLV
jgi:hypothetical protein